MRYACLSALTFLFATLPTQAGLGLTLSEAEAAYGPNRLTAPKTEDFLRLEISTNVVAISEHVLSNRVQVAVGYLPDDAGDLRGAVVKYTFRDAKATPVDWVAPLLRLNAAGGTWNERNLSPGVRPLKEYLRDDYQARFRYFEDAPQAMAIHRDYDHASMGEAHQAQGVNFVPAKRPAPSDAGPAQ